MYNPDTEVLFPERVIQTLRGLRGEEWATMIDQLSVPDGIEGQIARTAFVLMMVRLCGCVGCNADSFRAMRGCTQCAKQSVKRSRGSDHDILVQFQQQKDEVRKFFDKASNRVD